MNITSKRTYVEKVFITLSNVIQNTKNRKIIIDDLKRILNKKYGDIIKRGVVFIVIEDHARGKDYHFHIYLKVPRGGKRFNKNRYKTVLRELFHMFPGRTLDIQGVKSPKKVVRYMLKSIPTKALVEYTRQEFKYKDSSRPKDILYSNIPLGELLRGVDKKLRDSYMHLQEIPKYPSLEEYMVKNIIITCEYSRSSSRLKNLWAIRQNLRVPKRGVDILFTSDLTLGQETNPINFYIKLMDKYGLSVEHMQYMSKVLYYLLVRADYYPLKTKSKSLLVTGAPRTGKTRLITRYKKLLGKNVFFNMASSRAYDFTGYRHDHKPIVVFDDTLRYPIKDSTFLLNLLRHEEDLKIDVKYGPMVRINPTHCIIISNTSHLVKDHLNLQSRLAGIHLNRIARWVEISQEEFLFLNRIVVEDLITWLDEYDIIPQFISYGIICDLAKETRGKAITS